METITRKDLSDKLGAFVSVRNGASRNGYNKAPNQFIIKFAGGVVFQSYDSLIGAYINGRYYFTKDHDYSNTTCLHTKKMVWYDRRGAQERIGGWEIYTHRGLR